MEVADALRVANMLGCLLALWILGRAAFDQWSSWNYKTTAHWWALTIWVFLGLEGPMENMIQGNPQGPRVVLQTLAVVFTLRALTIRDRVEADHSVPWKDKNVG